MDPFLALGVASSIITFVDFGAKLLSGGSEIYRGADGATGDNLHLGILTKDLNNLAFDLELDLAPNRPLKKDEQALLNLASLCKDLADEFLTTLERLRVKGRNTKWKSFTLAVKSIGKDSDIRVYKSRLEGFRAELTVRLVAILTYVAPR